MTTRLPSLNLLTVFEAAARHLSFKNAAEELCISPPAISHQIKVLENQLNVSLFKRLNRALELTPVGQSYYEEIRGALRQLNQATSRIIERDDKQSFRISSIPFITNSLLVPHIQEFQNKHSELNIQISSQIQRTGFVLDDTDVAIRHKKGDEPSLHYQVLSQILITPVCSPVYLSSKHHSGPIELKNFRLIRLSTDKQSWPYWLEAWKNNFFPEEELCLDNYQAVLDAVKQGMGIAMGYLPSLLPLIDSGELVLPFPNQISKFNHLYLVYLKAEKSNPEIASFQSWITNLVNDLWSDKKYLSEAH
mgnify:FL=1